MKIKKLLLAGAVAMSMAMPAFATEINPVVSKEISTEAPISARAQEIMTRLEEIKAMDIKSISRTEKKALRKEVKAMEKEMKQMSGGGVYISLGGLLLIILILILIF